MSSASTNSSRTRFEHEAPFEYLGVPRGSRASISPQRKPEDREPDLERSTLVSIISPSVYQAQLFSSFIKSLSYNGPREIVPAQQCHSIWMSAIVQRSEISSTLLWAIRATSLSHLGLQMQDRNLINNSRNMYGRALLKLNKSLQDPTEGLSSDTLSATILLSFYEMMTCTERNSWVRHAGGAGNLIRLRGPDRHRHGFDSTIFLSCRYTLILEAYQSRTPCFLALPEWKQLSRYLQETSEFQSPLSTVREDMFQEAVGVPGYVTTVVDCMTNDRPDVGILSNLVRQGHRLRSNYKSLHSRFHNILRDAGQEPSVKASASNDDVFPVVYQYPATAIGSFYLSYWSFIVMINVVLIGLEARLSELSSPEPPNPERQALDQSPPQTSQLPHRTMPRLWMLSERVRRGTSPVARAGSPSDYPTMNEDDTRHRREIYMTENIMCAKETCKSVESISLSVFLGPLFLIFALRVALGVLTDEREKQWIMGKLSKIGKSFGIAKVELDFYQQQERRP